MNWNHSANRTRIKVCGLRSVEQAQIAVASGADAIGLVFHRSSPRFVDIAQALKIRQSIPAFITVTALFMNEQEGLVEEVVQTVRPDLLQFHGAETAAFCGLWERPYIKAIAMGDDLDALGYATAYPDAMGFLMDSHAAGRQGGSGDTFDWSRIPAAFQYPLILAGGLNPRNVAQAVSEVRPYAVDVSSGVESSRGVKDATLIRQFCKEVYRVDCQH
jgi:phosphoribosylanthranilate isomerase